MFKKLKDKIAEEVKGSPQRIQQFTQSVTEKIQNATSDESFFSIGEDDSSTPEPGFSNVSLSNLSTPQSGHIRKNSNSSIASDISFLPRYESSSNLYHLQSDLDVSASELEDNVSTSSQLGHLTKEQIYAAFQKAQMRYHKYRGRYSDVANYYKELEKENGKIKVVLVETQDKALRRVAELREQCSLEQKAKAHLENALRLELDEKQYVIDTLKTKVNLLQGKNSNLDKSDVLVNLDDTKTIETLTNDLKLAQSEIENLNSRLQEFKANSIVFNSKEADLKKKISEMEEINRKKVIETEEILERERENNLIIAQTKMELHTEIQNRDLEIQNLKHDLEVVKADLENYESKTSVTKLENLHNQNTKLIDKVESLTQKCQGYESELLKLEQLKIENEYLRQSPKNTGQDEIERLQDEIKQQQAKFDSEIATYREDTKRQVLSLEAKIKEKLDAENKEHEHNLQAEFEEKLLQVSQSTETVPEVQLKLMQKDNELKSLLSALEDLERDLSSLTQKYNSLEKNHLELIMENSNTQSNLKSALKKLQEFETNAPKLSIRTQTEIANLQKENLKVSTEASDLQSSLSKVKEENVKLQQEILNLTTKISDFEGINSKYKHSLDDLRIQIQMLEKEKLQLITENKSLQSAVSDLKKSISDAEILKNEVEQLNHNLMESPTDLANIEFENTILNELNTSIKSLTCLQDQVRDLTEKNSTLQLELKKESKEELAKTVFAFQEKIKEQKAKFHADMQSLNSEVLLFKERNELIQTNIQEYKQKLSEYEAASFQKTAELQEAIHDNKNLKQLLQKSEDKLQDVETMKIELEKKDEENTRLKIDLQTTAVENSDLKNKVSSQIGLIEEKQTLQQQLQKSESDLKTLYEDYTQLQATAGDYKNQVSRLEKLEEYFQSEIRNNSVVISQLEDEISKLKTAFFNAQSNANKYNEEKIKLLSENSALLNINDELNQEAVKCESAHSVMEKELSSLKNCVSNSKIEIDQLTITNTELLINNDDLNKQIRICKSDLELRNDEKVQTEEKCVQLHNLIDKLTTENSVLQGDVGKLEQETNSLNDMLMNHQYISDNYNRSLDEITELKSRNNELSSDVDQTMQENDTLLRDLAELKLKYETLNLEKATWQTNEFEKSELLRQLEENRSDGFDKQEFDTIKIENKKLKTQVQSLIEKDETHDKEKRQLEGHFLDLEHQYTEITHERQLLQDEIQELKISPININSDVQNTEKQEIGLQTLQEDYEKEINQLNEKLVQYRSLDLTNRSSIQFYENELQKIKNKNEKLNRKLDETLVTLNHCADLSTSTETEYLRNVLYNYMLGKESLILARVIAAVCKFDETQTEAILEREQQKQTLLGQLGFR